MGYYREKLSSNEVLLIIVYGVIFLALGFTFRFWEQDFNVLENEEMLKARLNIYIILVAISFILFIIECFINRKPRAQMANKNIENLSSPLLSEIIIDGKLDLKKFLTSGILQLKSKGYISISLENELLVFTESNEPLTSLEEEFLTFIFNGHTEIKFSEINKAILESDGFFARFIRLKNTALQELEELGLYSKKLIRTNRYLKLLSIVILMIFPRFFLNDHDISMEINAFYTIIVSVIIFLEIGELIRNINNDISFADRVILEDIQHNNMHMNTRVSPRKFKGKMGVAGTISLCIGVVLGKIFLRIPLLTTFILSILVLNILTLFMNRGIILTKKGKMERKKLLELAKYLREYSLIKDRNIDANVIWDEYLAYASAFGISTKATDLINEKWYNIEIQTRILTRVL